MVNMPPGVGLKLWEHAKFNCPAGETMLAVVVEAIPSGKDSDQDQILIDLGFQKFHSYPVKEVSEALEKLVSEGGAMLISDTAGTDLC
jgi:hypothetical protein